jgi:hypothetical protein
VAHSGAFAASTEYRAVLTLTAKSGFTFTGLAANSFSYTEATSVTNDANSGTVTITFPATDADPTAPDGGSLPNLTMIAIPRRNSIREYWRRSV